MSCLADRPPSLMVSAARRAAVRELDRMGLLALADDVLEGGGTELEELGELGELTAAARGVLVVMEAAERGRLQVGGGR